MPAALSVTTSPFATAVESARDAAVLSSSPRPKMNHSAPRRTSRPSSIGQMFVLPFVESECLPRDYPRSESVCVPRCAACAGSRGQAPFPARRRSPGSETVGRLVGRACRLARARRVDVLVDVERLLAQVGLDGLRVRHRLLAHD